MFFMINHGNTSWVHGKNLQYYCPDNQPIKYNQMLHHSEHKSDQINDSYCQCSVCISDPSKQQHRHPQSSCLLPQTVIQNSMLSFIELFPKNFPLPITPTASPKNKFFYFNKFGNRLMMVPYTKLTDHFPLAINVVLFYPNKSLIAHKYEIIKEDQGFTYVQVYSPNGPFAIQYKDSPQGTDKKQEVDDFMDEVLTEKLASLVKNMVKNDSYQLSFNQKDFLTWVHKDYHDQIFCKYMTKFYCSVIEKLRKDRIISGRFEWIIQKLGVIRLANVKYLVIQRNNRSATFQEEYQQKILQKLKIKDPIQTEIFKVFAQKTRINYRITSFKNSIRQIFNQQKLKILKNTQKQRTVDSKTLSDDVARLFLPQLHHYSNLREVLNDEAKFKKVVLGIEETKKKDGRGHLKRGKSVSHGQNEHNEHKMRVRHHRSRTQV